MCCDMSLSVKVFRTRTRDFQIENLRIETHENTVLLTKGRNAMRVFIEGPQRKIVCNLINHVSTQVLRESIEAAAQQMRSLEASTVMPFPVDESKNSITPFWRRIQSACKLDRTPVRPQNQYVSEITAVHSGHLKTDSNEHPR